MKGVLISTALVIGLFFFFVQTGEAISCYECNSHNHTECADKNPPEKFKKDCMLHSEGSKFTMCRKIVQNIDFEVNGNPADTRTIRGCGWSDSTYKGKCYQRSGFGGRQEVCSCLTDLCNGAGILEVSYFAAFAAGALMLARFNV